MSHFDAGISLNGVISRLLAIYHWVGVRWPGSVMHSRVCDTAIIYLFPANLLYLYRAVFGGWLSDRHSVKKAKKAGGIFEPEYRLSLFWLPSLIIPCGLLMMGLGPYYEAHWIVFVLGMTLVNMAGPLATVLVISYAFDCYHPIEPRDTLGPQAVTVQAAPYILTSMFIAMAMAFGYVSDALAICA